MDAEVTLFSRPEELIAWADTFDILLNPSIEDAAILLKACAKERAVFKELNIGKSIWKSLIPDSVSDGKDAQYNKETIRDRKEQPER